MNALHDSFMIMYLTHHLHYEIADGMGFLERINCYLLGLEFTEYQDK